MPPLLPPPASPSALPLSHPSPPSSSPPPSTPASPPPPSFTFALPPFLYSSLLSCFSCPHILIHLSIFLLLSPPSPPATSFSSSCFLLPMLPLLLLLLLITFFNSFTVEPTWPQLVNPCYSGSHDCDTTAQCVPLEGQAFRCQCATGYRGDGRNCYGAYTFTHTHTQIPVSKFAAVTANFSKSP